MTAAALPPPTRAKPVMRRVWFCLGCLLVIVTPPVALLPGPGGTMTFALGFGLMLKNSRWAKRRYVLFKRRWPGTGAWVDWGLRRASARRRVARDRLAGAACD
ncbi:hypothetical protein [Sphingomonas profundi]|uniref:hypothetical protein n=1 Tax=Alterirhizorhabdus profundi TaxID=2681549 RepID=UPI001E5DBE3B|nr:hypothetical protein [Sphingomonas profundi]